MLGNTNPTSTQQPPQVSPMATATTPPLVNKVGSTAPQTPSGSPKQPKKIFGVDQRALLTVLGLTLFFVLSMAGVVISLRQRINRQSVAPNAPDSQVSADVVTPANCSLSFLVTSDEPDPDPEPEPSPSDEPEPSPSDEPEPDPDPEPGSYSCNSSCQTNEQCFTANADYLCYENRCRLQTNISSTSCTPPGGGNEYPCNSTCQTNEQCRTVDEFHLCYQGRCRLDINVSSTTCQEPEDQTQAQVGCNETCTANTDCSNPSHICFNSQCRLETNPASTNCTRPTTPGAPRTPADPSDPTNPSDPDAPAVTTVPGQTQPDLPAELPKSGPEDWGNWLKAGLAALGVGAILLLLL